MPEQQSLAIEPAAPAAAPAAPAAKSPPPPRRFELPAESPPKAAEAPKAPEPKAETQTPPEEAPEAQPEVDKPEPTPEEAEKRRESRRFERRIDKATRRAAEAEARAKLAEERLTELQKPKAPADDAAPTLAQFDYDPEKYAAAKAEYATKQKQKEWETNQRTAAARQRQEKLASSWEEKVEKGSDEFEDFHTVVGELQPTNPLVTAIMAADHKVAYHLGKHPKEAEKLAEMDPIEQILAVGRLEAKLLATPEKPKAPSKAPAPIKPLSGAGSTASDVPSEQDDIGAWIRKRQKQVHGKNR